MATTLKDRFRFFQKHAGYIVGKRAECAMRLARAEEKAETVGLTVVWEWEEIPWEPCHEGETPPANWLCGLVYKKEDVDEYHGTVKNSRATSYACLGCVGVDSMRDPYLRVCAAEMLAEALSEIDKEWQAEADELAKRPTLAGVSP